MSSLTFFVGSYTKYLSSDFGGTGEGIYTVELNTDTGQLTQVASQNTVNPSYLAVSADNQYLYASTEVAKVDAPKVRAFKVNQDLSLTLLNEQAIVGGYPCHIETLNDSVYVACYETGNVLQFPLDDKRHLSQLTKNYQHTGSSVNKARQEGPHCHQVVVHPNNKDIYVCDLGIDTIKGYQIKDGELVEQPSHDITVSQGGGVRHMVFSADGTFAYALNELTGAVSIIKNTNGIYSKISEVSSLPDDYKGLPSASAIRLHPNGRWLYAANRQLEAVTVFSVENETLRVVDYQYTNGHELRECNITPDGKWLIACHQNSHDTIAYAIQGDGTLQERYRTKDIKSPVCVTFLQ